MYNLGTWTNQSKLTVPLGARLICKINTLFADAWADPEGVREQGSDPLPPPPPWKIKRYYMFPRNIDTASREWSIRPSVKYVDDLKKRGFRTPTL